MLVVQINPKFMWLNVWECKDTNYELLIPYIMVSCNCGIGSIDRLFTRVMIILEHSRECLYAMQAKSKTCR